MTRSMSALVVWDASHPDWSSWPYWREAERWAREQGIIDFERGKPRSATYRVEIWLIDTPFARCFRYAQDAEGHVYQDPATGEAASTEPEDIPLAALPPEHLRAVA